MKSLNAPSQAQNNNDNESGSSTEEEHLQVNINFLTFFKIFNLPLIRTQKLLEIIKIKRLDN